MKRSKIAFSDPSKNVRYLAKLLQAGTLPSLPSVVVPAVSLVPAILPKAAIGTVGQPGYIPAVAAVPAIPAKPAVMSPAITPLPQFFGSVAIEVGATNTKITAVTPFSPAREAMGKAIDASSIGECTPSALVLDWYGDTAGTIPAVGTKTVEQAFYDACKALPVIAGTTNSIKTALYQPNPTAPKISVMQFEVYVAN
jgi:hypothetical protein